MSIALTYKIKELESKLQEVLKRLEALEKVYNAENVTENDAPKRRGRPSKHDNA